MARSSKAKTIRKRRRINNKRVRHLTKMKKGYKI